MKRHRQAFLLMASAALSFCPMASAGAKDIADTIAAAPELSAFHSAITEAGLIDLLRSNGPLTVFVPTNEAFARLPAGTMAALLKPERKIQLIKLLKYHIVPAQIPTGEIARKEYTVKSLAEKELLLDGDEPDEGIKINKGKVVKPDIKADNGVIHYVDRVMLP